MGLLSTHAHILKYRRMKLDQSGWRSGFVFVFDPVVDGHSSSSLSNKHRAYVNDLSSDKTVNGEEKNAFKVAALSVRR